MTSLPASAQVPLVTDAEGTVRVAGTRVTLDSIIMAFRTGATAEEIAQQLPTLPLPDIYQVIAHCLKHPDEVEAYLARRQSEASAIRRQVESDTAGVRLRLLSRHPAGAG